MPVGHHSSCMIYAALLYPLACMHTDITASIVGCLHSGVESEGQGAEHVVLLSIVGSGVGCDGQSQEWRDRGCIHC